MPPKALTTCLFRTLLLLLLCGFQINAQKIYYFSSRYDDQLYQWILMDSAGNECGTLDYAMLLKDPLRSWNLTSGSFSGNIKLRWRENINEYDLYLNNHIIGFHPVWIDQLDQWNINCSSGNFNLSFLRNKEGLNWELKNSKNDLSLRVKNIYQYDPRDWTIQYSDNTTENEIVLASIFIIINYSKQFIQH